MEIITIFIKEVLVSR